MKKTLILLSLFIATISVAQEKTEADTTRFRLGENTIVFINSAPDSLHYDYDLNNSDSLCLKAKHKDNTKIVIDIGTNGYLTSEGKTNLPTENELWELNYGRSRSFGFAFQFKGYQSKNEHFYISPGLGLTWNSYHFENNIAITTNDDLTSSILDTITDNTKYKLRATYLEIPLIVGTKLGKINLQVGAIGGLRIGSIIKQKFETDGIKHTIKIKDDFNLNPFKVDFIARVTIEGIGLYARYSATTLFEQNKGPELYPFSIGLTLSDF